MAISLILISLLVGMVLALVYVLGAYVQRLRSPESAHLAERRMTFMSRSFDPVLAAALFAFVLGVGLALSPFVAGVTGSALANDVVVGALVALLAATRLVARPEATWMSWVSLLLGLWTILAPWALGFSGEPGLLTSNVVLGILVSGAALWAIMVPIAVGDELEESGRTPGAPLAPQP